DVAGIAQRPLSHPELTTARSGSLADRRSAMMAKATASYRQPERRPNADHYLLPIGGLVNVGRDVRPSPMMEYFSTKSESLKMNRLLSSV
ncbi:MAG TPA: hypothetical protein VGI22_20165, partial [Xanthobacteraceae bacterium]